MAEHPVGHSRPSKPRRMRVRSSLYKFTPNDPQSLIELRKRLRRMSDRELHRFVQAAKHMTTLRDSRHESFVIQLREAQDEWTRRKC
jgi:predicted glycosyltransferase involved in capsule biosynthesis